MKSLTSHATLDGNEYRVEFDETVGYDCMTGGFAVVRRNGDIAAEVDLRHYGQKPCDYEGSGFVDAKERAEAVAHRICAALNAAPAYADGMTADDDRRFNQNWEPNGSVSALSEIAPLRGEAGDWIDAVVLDICEIPDRTSPEDEPEIMLVKAGELRRIILENLPSARSATTPSALVEACRGLIHYWTRNLNNLQWEKADTHVKRINAALPEAPHE